MILSARSRVFTLFALGYFVSYIFRGLNLGFAPFLTQDLGLSAADLGVLTSLYFLGFAAAQIPAGVLLDRFGPRRVNAALLLVTAFGVLVFGAAHTLATMMVGRLMIGIGVSVCLGGAFKALAQTFPAERLPFLNGLVMAVGGLGGVVVGSPLTYGLTMIGWRGICVGLAILTVTVAFALWIGAPDAPDAPRAGGSMADQLRGTWQIASSAFFWREAGFSCATQGMFYATQSLWVGAFLRDVAGRDAAAAAALVSLLGVAMMVGCVSFGSLAKALERRGLSVHAFCGLGMVVFMLDEIAIILQLPIPAVLLWAAYGFFGGTGILTYAVLTERVPAALVGRSNTTLTLVLFLAIFTLQIGIGAFLSHWPAEAGHYPAIAHRTVWSVMVAVQMAAGIFYFWPVRTRRNQILGSGALQP